MVDIQSATAEIRRGKKKKDKDRRKKPQDKNIMPPLHRAAIIARETTSMYGTVHTSAKGR